MLLSWIDITGVYICNIDEDLRLNNELFGWPAKIEPMFEVSQLKLASRREEAEIALKNRSGPVAIVWLGVSITCCLELKSLVTYCSSTKKR